ncbi:prepilin peptidase, partial [Bordetella pertussis]
MQIGARRNNAACGIALPPGPGGPSGPVRAGCPALPLLVLPFRVPPGAMWHVFPLDPALNVVLAALLGLVAGSWLSVVAHRLPRMMEREWRTAMREEDGGAESGYGLWRPAWHCPSCQAALRGWRAVPLAGWLLQ